MPFLVIADMIVQQEAYIYADQISITKHAIFIHMATQIFSTDFYESQKDVENFILIRKVGDGWTEEDFCLDFTPLAQDYIFDYECNINHNDLMLNRANYIVFNITSNDVVVIEDDEYETETIESLELDLQRALENEEFEKAAEISNKLKKLKE